MIKAFLKHGHILRELNRKHITLISRKDNSKEVNDYRPISLCDVSYKFVSKLLANRLRLVLLKIISSISIVFIRNRDIHDNVLIAYVILSIFNKEEKARDIW